MKYLLAMLLASLGAHALAIHNDVLVKSGLSGQTLGLFKRNDLQLDGLRWANWGSRPYEYYWVSNVVPVNNKRVIDLGVGLPSQHSWFRYVIDVLKPAFYVGIDADGRIIDEVVETEEYKILQMDMSALAFQDNDFDIAYCISTFEHIPFQIFMKAIKEVYRILKDDGVLVLTLDEQWDKDKSLTRDSDWNNLEQSLVQMGLIDNSQHAFGLPDFLNLIRDFFIPLDDDLVVDFANKIIFSQKNGTQYYIRQNRDHNVLHSPECYNSCVSYVVLKKNLMH